MLSFLEFNVIEGFFWILLSALVMWGFPRIPRLASRLGPTLSGTLFFFGLSDLVEAIYPVTFLEQGGWWLFLWKSLCVAALVFCAVWYVRDRTRGELLPK
jgi:hypothetical protein